VIVLALAALLATGGGLGAVPPLACPSGAERRGLAPPEGFEEWCAARDEAGKERREGPARRYYDDGGVWVEEAFHAGERDGAYLEYHRGGGKAREGAYIQGVKVGRWTVWSPSGKPEEESDWREGVLHGRFVSYWPSGARRAEGRHCGGAQCGTWRTWDEGGALLGSVDYAEPTLAP